MAVLGLMPGVAAAQESGQLEVSPAPDLTPFESRPLGDVRVETLGVLFREAVTLTGVRVGDKPTAELVRRGMRELEITRKYAEIRAELVDDGKVLTLVYWVRPRRQVGVVRVSGSKIAKDEETRALGLTVGHEFTEDSLRAAKAELILAHQRAGYQGVRVTIAPEAMDDPMEKLIRVEVTPGDPTLISEVRFLVLPSPHHPELLGPLSSFGVTAGDRLDQEALTQAKEDLTERLMSARFFEAKVEIEEAPGAVVLVRVRSGPRFSVLLEGSQHFGRDRLEAELSLESDGDLRAEVLEPRLREFFVREGFLDADVRFSRRDSKSGLVSEIYGWIREGERFTVGRRIYPCAGGAKTTDELEEEVDGVLAEKFPGVAIIHPAGTPSLDAAIGSPSSSRRPTPLPGAPYESYSAEAYAAVRAHLEDLYRSDGYLGAEVGPLTLVRRQCQRGSPPGECWTDDLAPTPVIDCSLPLEKRDELTSTCTPDKKRGISCEKEGTLVIPIRPGPQAVLYDVALSGNTRFTEKQLLDEADLALGKPARFLEMDKALQKIRDLYAEEAYAFALVDSEIELSPDRTRARLVVSITEREQVRISRIEIRGATRTREGLIRKRLSIVPGELYRASNLEKSQRQIESLSVFSSVSVGMEDPGVPAREKVVVITVSERMPQYLDIKGGLATADGFRIGFEYGHRNLGGNAIQLTLRSQLGYRPPILIPEEDVRVRYQTLDGLELLERRNTVTVAFPEIGLGPLFRFEVEFLDVRDNNRDFAQTRDAGLVRLLFRPSRTWWAQAGATVEQNIAELIGVQEGDSSANGLEDYVRETGSQVRVPLGKSLAITQNLSGAWDRRDRAFAATRGTYLGLGVEHVTALPLGKDGEAPVACDAERTSPFDQVCSELLRWTGRVSGYIPFNKKGLSLALSFRGGTITHLTAESETYPDRLFFMGGIDTLRGYQQDSLVPEDVAEAVVAGQLAIESVVLRGGDFFINPRAELRIPVLGSIHTAVFVDAGNLWTKPDLFNLGELRYTVGTGLRIETPVGPLVLDYGFNIERVIDGFSESTEGERFWEDLGAFHFSIGLF